MSSTVRSLCENRVLKRLMSTSYVAAPAFAENTNIISLTS